MIESVIKSFLKSEEPAIVKGVLQFIDESITLDKEQKKMYTDKALERLQELRKVDQESSIR